MITSNVTLGFKTLLLGDLFILKIWNLMLGPMGFLALYEAFEEAEYREYESLNTTTYVTLLLGTQCLIISNLGERALYKVEKLQKKGKRWKTMTSMLTSPKRT